MGYPEFIIVRGRREAEESKAIKIFKHELVRLTELDEGYQWEIAKDKTGKLYLIQTKKGGAKQ